VSGDEGGDRDRAFVGSKALYFAKSPPFQLISVRVAQKGYFSFANVNRQPSGVFRLQATFEPINQTSPPYLLFHDFSVLIFAQCVVPIQQMAF
jgi:hypothetical protein